MGLFKNGKCKSKVRLDGKTAVITGANTGIGFETARDLVKRGCRVVLACRNADKAQAAADKLRAEVEGAQVRVVHLDLASLQSVKHSAELIRITEDKINLLINNAGLICPYWTTEDGYEMMFQCNHLAHFLFTSLLLDKIKQSAPARITNVSSIAHYGSHVNFDDLQSTKSFSTMTAYSQSKLCNVLFTLGLQEKLKGTRVVCYSLHPGVVATEMGEELELGSCLRCVGRSPLTSLMKNPQQGAQTTLHCALEEKLEEQNGLYYSDCKRVTAAKRARDQQTAEKLWNKSEELVKNFLT